MGVQPPPGWLNADQSGVFADNHDVTKAQLLARLGGVVAVSAVLAGLIGVGAGFGAYHFAHDPNDTAFLADLLPALFSLCVGTLIGVCAYVVISMRALKMALPKERITGSVRFRVLVAPIVVGVAIRRSTACSPACNTETTTKRHLPGGTGRSCSLMARPPTFQTPVGDSCRLKSLTQTLPGRP